MINWTELKNEAAELLSEYIKIQSLNPPGNEREAVKFLDQKLRSFGFEPRIYESGENRFNLLARLPGNGKKKPILLYHHMDVVEADPERWSDEPFSGAVRDGYVWGRGAIDMKGMGIAQLIALNLLKDVPNRDRDIIFFAAADEEKGGNLGTKWMIENHWEDMNPEFVWDEGGFGLIDFFGSKPVFTVAVAEKKDLWIKLIARGEPGHSGMPHDDNAANILLRALDKVLTLNSKYEISDITKELFVKAAETMTFPRSFLLKNAANPVVFKLFRSVLTSDPTIAAMMKDTLSVTVLRAGGKENIIPERAEATLDIRLLPNRSPQDFLSMLENIISDVRIEISILNQPEDTSISSTDTEFYKALTDTLNELEPSGVVAPMLTPGTTDSCFFRRKNVNSYGLFPAIISPGELARFHGIDERISLENLEFGIKAIYSLLKRMC